MTGVGVGGLVSLVASVSIIAIVGRMTSHGLSIPAVGGAPGGLSVLLGDGGAARDLLQSTTTESLVHRIVRGGMIGLGGRIAAPLGHRITTGRTRLPTRSAGRSYTRFQNVSAPYTVTRLASAGTRVTSSGIPDTKTTAQLLRQSIDIPDSPGSTYVRDEATIGYGALTTTSALKTPATLEIIQKHPAKNLIGTASVTTQPYGVLPTFTDDKNKRQTNGQEQETHNDDVVTTDRSQESSVEFHYTTLTYTHQTNVRKRNVPSHTSSNNKIVTETLQTGDVTPVDIHVDTNMTDTQTGTESPTHTEWIDELTTEIFTGGETSVAQSTGSSGRGKTANGGSEATTTVETHSSAIVSTDIGENTRTVGLLNGDDTSAGGTDTSTRANALTNGAFTHHMVVDGASTIGPQYSSNHITIDAIDTVTTENNVSGVGISVVTRHPQSKGIQSMIKRDTTVALDHTTSTQRDNPSTMTAYSETTRARLIVKTGGNTTTSRLIKYNAQNSTIPTDAPSTIKETTYVIGQATTTTTDQVGNGKASAGVNVSIVNWGETTTGDATILASHKTEIVTTLPRSANSQDMSTRVTTQEVDISNEGNIVTFEPTVSNEKEAVSGFITEGNGRTRTSDVRGEPSTNEQTTTGNESGDTISDEHSATNAYTVRDPAYYATASYTPMEQSSTNSNVKFDLNPTTSSFETISDSTESTNNITTASIVHARYNMATRLALASEVSLSTHHPVTTSKTLASEVSLSTHYPATTSKTSPARNADSRRDLPTTTYRTPYAIHLVKAKPTQPIALVTHISPSQDIYGSKTGNSDAETNSVPTRDTITTEEVTSTINPTYLTRTLSDDEIATPSALYTSQICNETEHGVWLTLKRLTMTQFDVVKVAMKVVIASAVDGFCRRHPDVCCYCRSDNPSTYEYGNMTEVHYAALESGDFTDDAHTWILLVAVTSGFNELCNMTSLQNSRSRLKRAVATNSSAETRASLPSRVLLIILRQPHVTADIANVIQASFPEVTCHVGVSSGQPVDKSPTIQPNLNNENTRLTPTTSLSVPRHRPVWLMWLIISSLVIFIGVLAIGSYAVYLKRPSKVTPIRILPV